MNKVGLVRIVCGILLVAGVAGAQSLEAKLIMRGNRSWDGHIVSREEGWISFKPLNSSKSIRIGVGTIKKLVFKVDVDDTAVSERVENLEYRKAIAMLEKAIGPFSEYNDIPSNIIQYNTLLLGLYYHVRQYDKVLEVSAVVAESTPGRMLRGKNRVYQLLSLLDVGRTAEAEALALDYGWDKEPAPDASAERLYVAAKLLVAKERYNEAILHVAKVVAFNSQDRDWMGPSELLCAEIYAELGLYDSAKEVCRQIKLLYKNSPEADRAAALTASIEKLSAE